MADLRGVDARSVQSAFSYHLIDLAGEDAFVDAASAMLTAVLPNDGVAWNHLDLTSGRALVRGTPAELESSSVSHLLAAHAGDHPIIRSYLRTPGLASSPRRMSDLASLVELQRTGSYAEVLRPLRIRYQLSIMTTREGVLTGSGWALSRGSRDFTDEEVGVATAVQAVLSALTLRPVLRATPQGVEVAERVGLTNREHQVLCLVAEGYTAQRIGHVLLIAPATVRKHLERVYAKFGVRDRLLAVDRGRALGLLGSGPAAAQAR